MARPSTPEWSDLLTEIAFCHNVCPLHSIGGISPFQMVFGREPRLSPADVCFPYKPSSKALSKKETAAHLQALHKKLQHVRFAATEAAIEEKELRRLNHDNKRSVAASARDPDRFVPGTIVSVHKPTPLLKKLTYQWSPPNHVVVKVSANNCVVRPLNEGGGESIEGRGIGRDSYGYLQSQDAEALCGA